MCTAIEEMKNVVLDCLLHVPHSCTVHLTLGTARLSTRSQLINWPRQPRQPRILSAGHLWLFISLVFHWTIVLRRQDMSSNVELFSGNCKTSANGRHRALMCIKNIKITITLIIHHMFDTSVHYNITGPGIESNVWVENAFKSRSTYVWIIILWLKRSIRSIQIENTSTA